MPFFPLSYGSSSEQQLKNQLGRRAEDLAAAFLESEGFELVVRNYRIGRDELDVVARRGSLLVFCEVRARTENRWISPAQTITSRKAATIRRGAAAFVRKRNLRHLELRLDVASVTDIDGDLQLNYLEAAL